MIRPTDYLKSNRSRVPGLLLATAASMSVLVWISTWYINNP